MRHPELARPMLAVAFIALAGSGCDQILAELQQAEQQHGGAATGTAGAPGGAGTAGAPGSKGTGGAAAGSSGSSSGSCVAEMGPTGICKRCYDASGALILEDCPPPPPPPLDAGACISIDDGGSSSCKDPATWQKYGAERCAQQNLVLTTLTPTGKCDQGYSTVTYTCCAGAPDGGTPPPPPPKCGQTMGANGEVCKTCWDATTGQVISNDCVPGPTATDGSTGGGACVEITDGGPTSCKDEGTWKMYGIAACAQKNLTLTDLKLVTACDNGFYSTVAYLCCGTGS